VTRASTKLGVDSLIVYEEKVLLVHPGGSHTRGLWTLLVGFAEPGKTIDEAILANPPAFGMEHVRFDCISDGKAQRCVLGGGAYVRVDTP
jgi:hypothetical protein